MFAPRAKASLTRSVVEPLDEVSAAQWDESGKSKTSYRGPMTYLSYWTRGSGRLGSRVLPLARTEPVAKELRDLRKKDIHLATEGSRT
jgi:hypothetical protein